MSVNSIRSATDDSSPHVQERGSLRTSGDVSQFIGSSSGVFFVNTVRRAFAEANVRLSADKQDASNPSPEDCLIADDEELTVDPSRRSSQRTSESRVPSPTSRLHGPGIFSDLGRPPPRDVGRVLFMTYFQTWHRFFPFLHGPTAGDDLESLYSHAGAPMYDLQNLPLARVIIFQCLFNLASLHSDVELPAASRIDQPSHVLSYLLKLAAKGDIISIQALFAAQLLLVARMSLRTAGVVAGLLSRAIFLAGLHRCPVRYPHLTAEDRDMRKRLFWSIYVVDRFLSQALGHPLGIQDSDVDVCFLSVDELHEHSHLPIRSPNVGRNEADLGPSPVHGRHMILACQVDYYHLLGRALELFHKSLHIRSIEPSTVLALRTDLDAWWNGLPSELQNYSVNPVDSSGLQSFNAPAFFTLLYNQLRLLINRPWLSLEPTTAEFQSSLQVCIGVSRDIIINMSKQGSTGYSLFWPGQLSAAWMAGVILAFACHLQHYPAGKGQSEIALCLEVLANMSSRWPSARNCHLVLSNLHQTVQQHRLEPFNGSSIRAQQDPLVPRRREIDTSAPTRRSKRRRTEWHDNQSDPPQMQLNEQGNSPALQVDHAETSARFTGAFLASHEEQRQRVPQNLLDLNQTPVTGVPDTQEVYAGAIAPNDVEMYDSQWISNWDGGMADILGGATWESLLHFMNPDNPG